MGTYVNCELTDGVYQVQDDKIWKYRPKGGKEARYDVIRAGDLISRTELFNGLAVIPAPAEANEYKAAVYALIQGMEVQP